MSLFKNEFFRVFFILGMIFTAVSIVFTYKSPEVIVAIVYSWLLAFLLTTLLSIFFD